MRFRMKKSDEEKTELEKKLEAEVAAEEADSAEAAEETVESASEQPAIDVESVVRERAALADQLLRMRAEFDNYRKRMARDADRVRQQAAESLIRDLLPVVDHLELAMKHRDGGPDALAEGIGMVLRQFHDVLARHGVEPITSAGAAFNPEVHEAVTQLGQLVLRPAKVVVSTGAPGQEIDVDDADNDVIVEEALTPNQQPE